MTQVGDRLAALMLMLFFAAGSHQLSAQASPRAIGVTLSHSLGSGSSAHPPPCGSACSLDDVLAPLSVSAVELERTLPILDRKRIGLDYDARLVPLAVVRNNPTDPAIRSPGGWSMPTNTRRAATVGIGIKPVGLRGWVGAGPARTEVDVSAGMLLFHKPLFAANAARVNFVYEVGVGIRLTPHGAVVGYRRHHVSNAGFADVNPGLDSHVVFVGLSIR